MAAISSSIENAPPEPSPSMAADKEKDSPIEITPDPSSSVAPDTEKEIPTEITVDPSPSVADKGKASIDPLKKIPKKNRGFKLKDINDDYIIKNSIGTAAPRRSIVYSAAFIPGPDPFTGAASIHRKKTTVAVKLVKIRDNLENFREAMAGLTRNERQRSDNILKINTNFLSKGYLCIAFPYREVSSLRSLLPEIGGGLPENCIKIALRSTIYGLVSIHSFPNEIHGEISAGNIFFHHPEGLIKLAFAASVYDPYFATDRAEMNEEEEVGTSSGYLAMKHVTKWGRAPEVLDTRRGGQRYEGFTQKSDTWNLGIVALELAYGEVRVKGRQDLLNLAEKISKTKKLPDRLWEERAEDEEEKKKGKNVVVEKLKGIWKKKDKRFSNSFGKMVAKCLSSDPDKRPRAWELIDHKFFRNCGNAGVFADSVVQNRHKAFETGKEEDMNPSSKSERS